MGVFDKMFGSGASGAAQEPNAEERFAALKLKYESVLRALEEHQVRLHNLHVENGKLFLRGIAPSDDAKNKVWDQIKRVNPTYDDIIADIGVSETRATAAVGGTPPQTYTVRPGDTLSKISKQLYGDANEYMRIFYANRDKLKDPDKIQVGQKLTIPTQTV
jgi:nucleoid-associated protein YgaU